MSIVNNNTPCTNANYAYFAGRKDGESPVDPVLLERSKSHGVSNAIQSSVSSVLGGGLGAFMLSRVPTETGSSLANITAVVGEKMSQFKDISVAAIANNTVLNKTVTTVSQASHKAVDWTTDTKAAAVLGKVSDVILPYVKSYGLFAAAFTAGAYLGYKYWTNICVADEKNAKVELKEKLSKCFTTAVENLSKQTHPVKLAKQINKNAESVKKALRDLEIFEDHEVNEMVNPLSKAASQVINDHSPRSKRKAH